MHLQITETPKFYATAAAKLLQSCPTLCDPVDDSPPGSPVPGILQARTLEWVAISFSNAWKWKVKVRSLSHVRLFVTPWTVAYQAFPSVGLSRQEYWSGMPSPSPSFYWDPSNSNVGVLNVVPDVYETILIYFHSFFFSIFYYASVIFNFHSSSLLICSATDPCSVFLKFYFS